MRGRNFLININGKTKKYGFFQNLVVDANNPKQAKLLGIAKVRHDDELNQVTLNPSDDPPIILVDTFWELDVLDDVEQLDFN